jgi:hypothetical protein
MHSPFPHIRAFILVRFSSTFLPCLQPLLLSRCMYTPHWSFCHYFSRLYWAKVARIRTSILSLFSLLVRYGFLPWSVCVLFLCLACYMREWVSSDDGSWDSARAKQGFIPQLGSEWPVVVRPLILSKRKLHFKTWKLKEQKIWSWVLTGSETKFDWAGEDQRQFTQPSSLFCLLLAWLILWPSRWRQCIYQKHLEHINFHYVLWVGAIFAIVAGFIQCKNVCFSAAYKPTKPSMETKKTSMIK